MELDRQQHLEAIINRINLCIDVIQDIHTNLEQPETPDEKADLLIAVENLARDIYLLRKTTQSLVWGEEPTEE